MTSCTFSLSRTKRPCSPSSPSSAARNAHGGELQLLLEGVANGVGGSYDHMTGEHGDHEARCTEQQSASCFFAMCFNRQRNLLQPASYFATTGVAFCYIAHGFVIFATTGHKKSCVRRRDLLQRPWRSSIAHGAPASSSDEHAGERADEHAGERADEHAGERRLRQASRRAAPTRKPTSRPTSSSGEEADE